jgi:hypothetical protein
VSVPAGEAHWGTAVATSQTITELSPRPPRVIRYCSSLLKSSACTWTASRQPPGTEWSRHPAPSLPHRPTNLADMLDEDMDHHGRIPLLPLVTELLCLVQVPDHHLRLPAQPWVQRPEGASARIIRLTLLSPGLCCPDASLLPELEMRMQLMSPLCCSMKNCDLAPLRRMMVDPRGLTKYFPHGVHCTPPRTLPVSRRKDRHVILVSVVSFS